MLLLQLLHRLRLGWRLPPSRLLPHIGLVLQQLRLSGCLAGLLVLRARRMPMQLLLLLLPPARHLRGGVISLPDIWVRHLLLLLLLLLQPCLCPLCRLLRTQARCRPVQDSQHDRHISNYLASRPTQQLLRLTCFAAAENPPGGDCIRRRPSTT
jgi:hypothetical protein